MNDRNDAGNSSQRLVEIIEEQRLKLCKAGLHPEYHDSLEKAVDGVLNIIEILREEHRDPPHHLQEVVLMKLAATSPGWGERLPEWRDRAKQLGLFNEPLSGREDNERSEEGVVE